jgi:hypothetical protein
MRNSSSCQSNEKETLHRKGDIPVDLDEARLRIQYADSDESLRMAERLFYHALVLYLTDEHGRAHLTLNEYHEQAHLGNGTVAEVIPRLIEKGYVRGTLTPKPGRGYESWLLYLADMPEQPKPEDRRKKVLVERVEGLKITITIEPDKPAKE